MTDDPRNLDPGAGAGPDSGGAQGAPQLDEDLFDFDEEPSRASGSQPSDSASLAELFDASEESEVEPAGTPVGTAPASQAAPTGDFDLDEDLFRFDELFTPTPRSDTLRHEDLFPDPAGRAAHASAAEAYGPLVSEVSEAPGFAPEHARPEAHEPVPPPELANDAPEKVATEETDAHGTHPEPPAADELVLEPIAPSAAGTSTPAAPGEGAPLGSADSLDEETGSEDLSQARQSVQEALALAQAGRDSVRTQSLASTPLPSDSGWNRRMVAAVAAAFLLVNISLVLVAMQLGSSMNRALDDVRDDLNRTLASSPDANRPIQVVVPSDAVQAATHSGSTQTELVDVAARELEIAHRELAEGAFPSARRRLYRLLANRDRLLITPEVLAEAEFLVAESYLSEAKNRNLTEADE